MREKRRRKIVMEKSEKDCEVKERGLERLWGRPERERKRL